MKFLIDINHRSVNMSCGCAVENIPAFLCWERFLDSFSNFRTCNVRWKHCVIKLTNDLHEFGFAIFLKLSWFQNVDLKLLILRKTQFKTLNYASLFYSFSSAHFHTSICVLIGLLINSLCSNSYIFFHSTSVWTLWLWCKSIAHTFTSFSDWMHISLYIFMKIVQKALLNLEICYHT